MSKWLLDSTSTARAYAIGSATNARVYAIGSAGVFILDKAVKYGFNYNYARATAFGSDWKVRNEHKRAEYTRIARH